MNWRGEVGRAWCERNAITPEELDRRSELDIGVRRLTVLRDLLADVDRKARVLEVGVGAGLQLELLSALGFTDLWGCDLNAGPMRELSNAVACDAEALPYRDASFDLVYTSGTLIHIRPGAALNAAIQEILRVSRRWVAGYEYHADSMTPVEWRGHRGLLWKNDWAALYEFAGASLARQQLLPHITGSGNVDVAFLLEKT